MNNIWWKRAFTLLELNFLLASLCCVALGLPRLSGHQLWRRRCRCSRDHRPEQRAGAAFFSIGATNWRSGETVSSLLSVLTARHKHDKDDKNPREALFHLDFFSSQTWQETFCLSWRVSALIYLCIEGLAAKAKRQNSRVRKKYNRKLLANLWWLQIEHSLFSNLGYMSCVWKR